MKKVLFTLLSLILTFNLYSQTELDYLILKKVNEYRVSLGLNMLDFCDKSFLAAQHHTEYMVSKKSIGHSEENLTPTPRHRLAKYGQNSCLKVGETCSAVSFGGQSIDEVSKEVVNNWKKSPKHNRIITDPELTYASSCSLEGGLDGYEGYNFILTTLVLYELKQE